MPRTEPYERFKKRMAWLRSRYPQRLPEAQWEAQVPAYFDDLRGYPVAALDAAFRRARQKHPDFFPSSGHLMNLADEFLSECTRREQQEGKPQRLTDDEYEAGQAHVSEILASLGVRRDSEQAPTWSGRWKGDLNE